MTPRTLYAFLVGALVGGGPFGLILLPAPTMSWSPLFGPVLAFALTATAYRSPGSWALGAIAGAVGAWIAFSLLIGGGFDWRLIVYMGVVFEYLLSRRRGRRQPGVGRMDPQPEAVRLERFS